MIAPKAVSEDPLKHVHLAVGDMKIHAPKQGAIPTFDVTKSIIFFICFVSPVLVWCYQDSHQYIFEHSQMHQLKRILEKVLLWSGEKSVLPKACNTYTMLHTTQKQGQSFSLDGCCGKSGMVNIKIQLYMKIVRKHVRRKFEGLPEEWAPLVNKQFGVGK